MNSIRALLKAGWAGLVGVTLTACATDLSKEYSFELEDGLLGGTGSSKVIVQPFQQNNTTYERMHLISGSSTTGPKLFSTIHGLDWTDRQITTTLGGAAINDPSIEATLTSVGHFPNSNKRIAIAWMSDGKLGYAYVGEAETNCTPWTPQLLVSYIGNFPDFCMGPDLAVLSSDLGWAGPTIYGQTGNRLLTLAATKNRRLHFSIFPYSAPPLEQYYSVGNGPFWRDTLDLPQAQMLDPDNRCVYDIDSLARQHIQKPWYLPPVIGVARRDSGLPLLAAYFRNTCADAIGNPPVNGLHMALFELNLNGDAELKWTKLAVPAGQDDNRIQQRISMRANERGVFTVFSFGELDDPNIGSTWAVWHKNSPAPLNNPDVLQVASSWYTSLDAYLVPERTSDELLIAHGAYLRITGGASPDPSTFDIYSIPLPNFTLSPPVTLSAYFHVGSGSVLQNVTGLNAMGVDFLGCGLEDSQNVTALWETADFFENTIMQKSQGYFLGSVCNAKPEPTTLDLPGF